MLWFENLPEPVERSSELLLGTPARIRHRHSVGFQRGEVGQRNKELGFPFPLSSLIPVHPMVRVDDRGWGPGLALGLPPQPPRVGRRPAGFPAPAFPDLCPFASGWPLSPAPTPHPTCFFIFPQLRGLVLLWMFNLFYLTHTRKHFLRCCKAQSNPGLRRSAVSQHQRVTTRTYPIPPGGQTPTEEQCAEVGRGEQPCGIWFSLGGGLSDA